MRIGGASAGRQKRVLNARPSEFRASYPKSACKSSIGCIPSGRLTESKLRDECRSRRQQQLKMTFRPHLDPQGAV